MSGKVYTRNSLKKLHQEYIIEETQKHLRERISKIEDKVIRVAKEGKEALFIPDSYWNLNTAIGCARIQDCLRCLTEVFPDSEIVTKIDSKEGRGIYINWSI